MAQVVRYEDSEELLRVLVAAKVSEVLGSAIGGSTKVPNPRPAEFLVIRRIGGSARDLVTDVPVIQIEAWAATESRAGLIANTARAVVHWLRDINGRTVELVEEVTGPVSFPDGSAQARYIASYAIAVRGSEITL